LLPAPEELFRELRLIEKEGRVGWKYRGTSLLHEMQDKTGNPNPSER
jgi:hypothetical protein